jgi:hypothetical protein
MTGRLLTNIARRVADGLDHRAEHREHDEAIRDSRLGAEHATAIDLAVSRGEPGCAFCR